MRPENLDELVAKYLDGSATQQERELLNNWFRLEQLKPYEWEAEHPDEESNLKADIFDAIEQNIRLTRQPAVIRRWPRYVAAASIILFVAAGSFFYLQSKKQTAYQSATVKTDALPGTSGAILTLANGQRVVLGKSGSGIQSLKSVNHIQISSDSAIVYNKGAVSPSSIAYNTLTTPNGRQFNVILPDGTKVWMNAGSTLQYPITFSGRERIVKLSGEAYFEVVHNAKMPFKVMVNGQSVNDIGTAFNINSYTDEPVMAVTLVEGSASISNNTHNELLHPGEQAVIKAGSDNIKLVQADIEMAMAWKNGLFHFEHAPLNSALRQIARWYDLKVEYEGKVPDITIDGDIYRDVKASQLFAILGRLNVNFRIEGNKLIVVPKPKDMEKID
ncbi:FecR family protein [Mucilaginibacter paludis]|uniref:Anti-FecI sigma factor, FecR n=1 Tax=Mucilaginibacter paludis DSM 18603 TaxID=714943 RepID=H1YBP4_9SPHI|nr:FecR family protein [Mucilaginibacter paludis]EHQ26007.1 anti-FecI sigma factor, FecR [Mucilaginibacter paludis DSM 18603]